MAKAKTENKPKVTITLEKSLIGRKKSHIATAKSLGLSKIRDTKTVEKNAAIDGKISAITHLISVTDAE